ncbi:hypothetical protein WKI65_33030 [Streptomyces sp. MS1.AVA.3]|uniref:hypothetical protein n=1 Tax=Streptomyces decoyicus TaxID=249567 RepID=UPI0030C4F3BF
MRYATTHEDDDALHRQDKGTTRALCGEDAPHDVDADVAAFGLIAGTRFICGPCDVVAVHRAPTRHGYRAAHASHDDVVAAVQVLAVGGFEPARNPDEYDHRARGFFVEPHNQGSVEVLRFLNGLPDKGEGAEAMLIAYARALRTAGWDTGEVQEDDEAAYFIAHRPAAGEEITTVFGDQPSHHPH